MTMNLDVTVRLLDETQRSGRAIERTLERISSVASKATGARGANGIRGLGRTLQEVSRHAPTQTTVDRVDRFGEAMGRLGGHASSVRQAASAIRGIASAVDRMSTLHKQFERSARSADLLSRALRNMPNMNTGFVSGANAQLNHMIRLQQQAITNMQRLNSGGGGGRRGMGGGNGGNGNNGGGNGRGGNGGHNGFYYDMHRIRGVGSRAVEASMTEEDAITRVRAQYNFGKDPVANARYTREIEQIKKVARDASDNNKSTTYAGNLSGILEARAALGGHTQDALKLYPKLADYGTVMAKFGGANEDQVKAAKESVYDAARAGELKGIIGTDEFDSMLQGMMASSIVTEGRVNAKSWASNIKYARSAGIGMSPQFMNQIFPFLMQEFAASGRGSAAGPAGNGLMSAYATVVQGRIAQKNSAEWIKTGQISASDLDKKGNVKPGSMKDNDLAISNFYLFLQKILQNFKDRGITKTTESDKMDATDKEHILTKVSALFGNRVAAGIADVMMLQNSRIQNFGQMTNDSGYGDPLAYKQKLALINASLSQSTVHLKNAYNDLLMTVTGPFVPAMTGFIKSLDSGAHTLKDWLRPAFGEGSDPNDPAKSGAGKWIGIGGVIATGLWSALRIARTWPAVGTMLGQAFVGIVTASPIAAFLARGTVAAAVAGLASQTGFLGTALSVLAAPQVGAALAASMVGYFSAYYAGKGIANVADSFRSKEGRDNLVSGYQKHLAEQNAVINDPNAGFFAKTWARIGACADRDNLDARGQPEVSGTPLAGKRAAGGPVGRGLSYLVGERGPEIFTPGASGAISTNGVMRQLGNGQLDGGALASTLSSAIRFQTFSLTSALHDLFNRLLAKIGFGGNNSAGTGFGGGSSGPGGGGVGRGSGGSTGSGDDVDKGGGSTPSAQTASLSRLARAGVSDRPVESGLDAFNIYGAKKRGEGIRPINPNGFTPPPANTMPGGKTDPSSVRGTLFSGESGGRAGIYNYRSGGRWKAGHFDPNTSTIGDIQAAQSSGKMFATGLYQVIPSTLKDAVRKLHLNATDRYDVSTQNRIFTDYLAGSKRPQIGRYIRGEGSLQEANLATAQEWASVADPRTGKSYYPNDKASISPARMQTALKGAKALYEDLISKGTDPKTAMRSALLGVRDGSSGSTSTNVGAFGIGGFNMPNQAPVGRATPSAGGDVGTRLRNLRRAGVLSDQQCVTLAMASVGIRKGSGPGGNVHDWRPGANAADGTLKTGTPVSTFLDRYGRQSNRYAGGGSGTPGANRDHAGVFQSYIRDKEGKILGMRMSEQYQGSGGVHDKNYYFGKGSGEGNASNYRAILGKDGKPIGGDRNPMAQVPQAVSDNAQSVRDQRAREEKRQQMAANTSGPTNHVGAIHIHPHPHQDHKAIADAVHRRFNDSVHSQLNDGAFA